jgi:hypothetical protein
MKEDLKRLLNEFIQETINYRTEKKDMRLTDKMPEKYEWVTRQPTFEDLLDWLNNNIEENE